MRKQASFVRGPVAVHAAAAGHATRFVSTEPVATQEHMPEMTYRQARDRFGLEIETFLASLRLEYKGRMCGACQDRLPVVEGHKQLNALAGIVAQAYNAGIADARNK
jgi:hypothetical protein